MRVAMASLALGLLVSVTSGIASPFRVEAVLPAGEGPNASLVALDGGLLVVANSDTGDLSLLELPSGVARPRVPVGRVPLALALSQDGRSVHVACFRDLSVATVDLVTGRRIRSVNVGVHPRDIVRAGDRILVSGYYEGVLVSLDAASGEVTGTLQLEAGLHRILVHPDGERAYVLNTSRDALYEVDVRTLRLRGRLGAEFGYKGNWDMVLTPDGSRIAVSQWGGGRVAVVRTGPLSVEGFVETGGEGPCALDASPDGRHVVVSHSESDDAAILDILRLHRRALLPVGNFPFSAVRITRDARHALVAVDNVRKLAVLDMETFEHVGEVAVGKIPHVITAGPDGRWYVSNTGDGSVSVVRRASSRERVFELLHGED